MKLSGVLEELVVDEDPVSPAAARAFLRSAMNAAAFAFASSLAPGAGEADLLPAGDASTGSGGRAGDSIGRLSSVSSILGEVTAS